MKNDPRERDFQETMRQQSEDAHMKGRLRTEFLAMKILGRSLVLPKTDLAEVSLLPELGQEKNEKDAT